VILSVIVVVAEKCGENDGFFYDVFEVILADENEIVHETSCEKNSCPMLTEDRKTIGSRCNSTQSRWIFALILSLRKRRASKETA